MAGRAIFRRRLLVVPLLAGLAVPAVIMAQDVFSLGEEEQKDWLTSFVQDRLSTPERQIRLSNIEGALGSDVSIREITISDRDGVWLRIDNASLNWNQAALFTGRLEVRSLKADSIQYLRNAVPDEGAIDLPTPEAGGLHVPEFPVAIVLDELSVPSVQFGESVFGLGSEMSLAGSMSLEGGNLDASLDIVRLDGPGGTLDLTVSYGNEDQIVDLDLALVEPENGVIANLLNIENRPAMTLALKGQGPITDLRSELSLAANGQTALSGVATVNQHENGIAIAADLGGPLSMLMAEAYRPFFGAQTSLHAEALLRQEGGFTLSSLTLGGGQLALQASAETTPDNFISALRLDATIADAAGGKVLLPVPGADTSVGSARLAVEFGGGAGENWSADLDIAGFATPDFSAEVLTLNMGGVAANLADPASRRVTFNGDGRLSGVSGSPEIEAAFGSGLGIGIAGLWNAGEKVQLAELVLAGEALRAALSGTIDGMVFTGDVTLETASIAPFSGLAGRDLNGALTLDAHGSILPLSGGFDLTLDGSGRNLAIGDDLADRLLAGEVLLKGRLARSEAGLLAENFRLGNAQLQLAANGNYASDIADFGFSLDLADLGLLSPEASGAVTITGTAKGQDDIIDLRLEALAPSGTLAGRALRDGRLGFAGRSTAEGLTGTLTGAAGLDGHQTSLAANLAVTPETQRLDAIDFRAAGTRVTGGVARNAQTGLMDGGLSVVSPDISVPAALALLKAQGGLNAEIRLAPEAGKQGASLRGDISNLVVNDIRVGAADINAAISDLFGVPAVNGSANASKVSAAGVDIASLSARADHAGDTTGFEAQARLAIGTDLDLAGTLTPVGEGFRLGLEQVEMVQGQLAARLARPSFIEFANGGVSLNDLRFDVGSGSISASGSAGQTLAISLDIAALPLNIANAVLPALGLAGTLDGRAEISGRADDPQVSFEARAQGIDAAAIGEFGIAPLSAQVTGGFGGNVVRLAALSADGNGGLRLRGSGSVPLSGGGLDIALTGSAPLALGNRFLIDRGGQLSGVVELDARVSGRLDNPQFSGRVTTAGAGYVDPELNLRLIGINGAARLAGTDLTIESLGADLATGGSVSASGSVGLGGQFPADMALAIRSARYADGNLFVATLSGNLALTGNLAGSPLLSGSVAVEEANITVPENFGGGAELINVDHVHAPRAVEQTLARARIDERSGAPIPQTRPAGLLLDIAVSAPNQIFVRGRGLDAEVGGSVRLLGPVSNIQPVGGFSLNRGRLSILGQRLDFDSGEVTLVGDLDPMLNFVARTQGDDITVFVTVSGRASNIDVSFTSSPMLPQDEVLSRLIFKRSMGELSPLQLARLAAAAGELMGGGGSLVDSLRGAAGLADLDVVTDEKGNVAVQAGTYIQDNVYLGVQAGADGRNKVTINLDLTDDLKVTGGATQDGASSLGIFYEKDY